MKEKLGIIFIVLVLSGCMTVPQKDIWIGMTKEQVVEAWGKPCGYCYGTRENSWGDSWEYNSFGNAYGPGTILYFDADGKLTEWSN